MPLPKLPTKPAALLSPREYPLADKGKSVKPLTLIEPAAPAPVATLPASKTAAQPVAQYAVKAVEAKTPVLVPEPKRNARADKSKADSKPAEPRARSGARTAGKNGVTKLFVLDTNVLMHDPTSLFRFEEHDVYLPMMTLEELDDHKKGMSEVARNARQVSRSLDALISGTEDVEIDKGILLAKLGNKDARGRLFFQTRLTHAALPEGLPEGKADNQILGVVRALETEYPGREIVLVSKDINMRIKARAMGLPAEEYFNDHVLEDTDLLYSGIMQLPDDFWHKHAKGMESWQENKHGTGYTFYRLSGPVVPMMLVNQFVFMEPNDGEPAFYGHVIQ
ncbi:MAG: PhoH family protein, partial [Herminiimonas sp.]|nr:PhoH family protein [Herminiimonas sp.]